ncbi:hypothetical protein CPLU01_02032 [Colletotrichum plurivorum]|uniref:Uncharacterized protein n=1 Tax=Colletotrichum plurivorum TaxID=2175906 RepID=A0A8H6KXL1_9PEZI|nr:hypothetical protein CPLU01_02032 [Colletotrichum plurivorum]
MRQTGFQRHITAVAVSARIMRQPFDELPPVLGLSPPDLNRCAALAESRGLIGLRLSLNSHQSMQDGISQTRRSTGGRIRGTRIEFTDMDDALYESKHYIIRLAEGDALERKRDPRACYGSSG